MSQREEDSVQKTEEQKGSERGSGTAVEVSVSSGTKPLTRTEFTKAMRQSSEVGK